MDFLKATVPGVCSGCGEAILRGEAFVWGKARGARVCVDCAGGALAPVATEWTGERVRRVPARTLSTLQAAGPAFVTCGSGNGLMVARAGAGKTSTIVEMAAVAPGDVIAVAFNKSISVEMGTKVPEGVLSSTFHSFWWEVLRRSGRIGKTPTLNKHKVRDIVRDGVLCDAWDEAEAETWEGDLDKLVDLAKASGMGVLVPNVPATWDALIEHYDVSFDTPEGFDMTDAEIRDRVVAIARQMLEVSDRLAREQGVCDYNDMLYCSLVWHLRPRQQFDWVFADEVQDFNHTQRALLRLMLKPDGRFMGVGDPAQAIYGFRGAASDSMDLIRDEFACTVLPLNESFRCPRRVVEEARQYCPDIVAAPGAAEGRVEDYTEQWSVADFDAVHPMAEGDLVVCRTTAPLISLAYRCIGKGVAVRMLGREIGTGLIALVKRMKARNLETLDERLGAYREREVDKLTAKGQEDKAQGVDDKVESIRAAMANLPENDRTVAGLLAFLDRLFDENNKNGLTLATVHKSKGQEARRVFILDRHLMPSKWARQAWQQEQERNLQYVAVTRALAELFYIDSETIS